MFADKGKNWLTFPPNSSVWIMFKVVLTPGIACTSDEFPHCYIS